MKKKVTHFYKLFLCTIILIGTFSCQTEELSGVDQSLVSQTASTSKRGTPLTFEDCNNTYQTTNLYAGQNILVGNVSVLVKGDSYEITYNITNNGYCLTSTHLSVVETPSDFPNAKGNAIPGQFEYKMSHNCVSSYTYVVPTSQGSYIAAHAVVTCKSSGTIENLDAILPATVNFCITTGREIDNAPSYLYLEISEGSLTGNYWAWCADESKSINSTNGPICYEQFNVYSLHDDLSGIISQPDNIDNALWLINHTDELLNSGDYLYGNIQWVLWKLLNNQECNSCNANLKLPSGDITIKGMELYNMAIKKGEGYNPACGENTIVILDDGEHQPIIIPYPVPCIPGDCEETAWGDGCDFPGKNWSTYFHYGEN